MNTNINNSLTHTGKSSKKIVVCIPQMLRLKLQRLECLQTPSKAKILKSKVLRSIEIIFSDSNAETMRCRVELFIKIDATWSAEEIKEPVIYFSANYKVAFLFLKEEKLKDVKKWMSAELNRHGLIAQTIPIVNLHMYSQLDMMGLNTHTRPLGIDGDYLLKEIITNRKSVARVKKENPTIS